jgi:hypothetical protein
MAFGANFIGQVKTCECQYSFALIGKAQAVWLSLI